jgi:hypothetical protein
VVVTATIASTDISATATVIIQPTGALTIAAPSLIDFENHDIVLEGNMNLNDPIVTGSLTVADDRTVPTPWTVGVVLEDQLALGTHVLTNALRYRTPGMAPSLGTIVGSTRLQIYSHGGGVPSVNISSTWDANVGFMLYFPGMLARVGTFEGMVTFDVLIDAP